MFLPRTQQCSVFHCNFSLARDHVSYQLLQEWPHISCLPFAFPVTQHWARPVRWAVLNQGLHDTVDLRFSHQYRRKAKDSDRNVASEPESSLPSPAFQTPNTRLLAFSWLPLLLSPGPMCGTFPSFLLNKLSSHLISSPRNCSLALSRSAFSPPKGGVSGFFRPLLHPGVFTLPHLCVTLHCTWSGWGR